MPSLLNRWGTCGKTKTPGSHSGVTPAGTSWGTRGTLRQGPQMLGAGAAPSHTQSCGCSTPARCFGGFWGVSGGDPVPFPPSLSEILALVVAGDGRRGQPELSPLGSRTSDEPPIPHAAFGDKTASKSPPGCLIPLPCTTWVPRTPVQPLGRNAGQRRDPRWGQVTTFGADPGAGRDR